MYSVTPQSEFTQSQVSELGREPEFKQAWLRAMETTGLKGAVDGMQVFRAPSSPMLATESVSCGKSAVMGRLSEVPVLVKKNSGLYAPILVSKSSDTGLSQIASLRNGTLFSPDPLVSGLVLIETQSRLRCIIGDIRPVINRCRFDGAYLTRVDSQRISVLRNSHGEVEIWIRDVSLDVSRAVGIIGSLRKTMGELGVSLVRGSLNGKQVFVRNTGSVRAENMLGG